MGYRTRATWKNHRGNYSVDPLRLYRAKSLAELTEILAEAGRVGCTVRAVGSHHSWSDVALTHGFLVETREISRILPLEPELLSAEGRERKLVRSEAGIRIRELNTHLDSLGLGLTNMGGYDEQTIAGVMSTSTHGSGIGLGPLVSYVRSIELLAADGTLFRIEPAGGITDPARYRERYPTQRLVQDDQWFDAVSVSMGCMGIIYAVTLEAEPAYWLKEVRTLSTWRRVRAELEGGVLAAHRHYEVYFNPHPRKDGEHTCLVTTRNRTEPPVGGSGGRLHRNPLVELGAKLLILPKVLNLLFDLWPRSAPRLVDFGLKSLADAEYTSRSYKVFNIGAANHLPAYSSEIGVPVDERMLHLEAVERIFRIAAEHARIGTIYHTSPVALRFVKASGALLSMMHGRDTMMIELILLYDTEGGFELLTAYEQALYQLGGRPHWGQFNVLTGSHELIASMYPGFAQWQAVREQLDPEGRFDSPFARRVGITRAEFSQAIRV
jgi:FAD/FMN-containing dehydrogenase